MKDDDLGLMALCGTFLMVSLISLNLTYLTCSQRIDFLIEEHKQLELLQQKTEELEALRMEVKKKTDALHIRCLQIDQQLKNFPHYKKTQKGS